MKEMNAAKIAFSGRDEEWTQLCLSYPPFQRVHISRPGKVNSYRMPRPKDALAAKGAKQITSLINRGTADVSASQR
jgi:hypothetical protein